MSRRVVISGMGCVTPLGHDAESMWAALRRAECAIGPVTRYDARSFATNFAAEVRGFRLADHLSNVAPHRGTTHSTEYALAAAAQAWRQAGLDRAPADPRRVGVFLGCGEGQIDLENLAAASLTAWKADARTIDTPAWTKVAYEHFDVLRELEQEPNLASAHLATAFPIRGPTSNCMTACAASTQAIGEAFEIIRRGDADVMVAGGSHSMIHPLGMTGFIRLTAMSTRRDDPATAARPFDSSRDGFVMGEGAGMVILESLDHFLARTGSNRPDSPSPAQAGQPGSPVPLVELAGYGSTADAFRITDIQPDGAGAAAAMTAALRQAGISPREPADDGRPAVHYISAHGTGTQENDKIETAAVKSVFGALAPRVPFSSVKSMLGHLIQAAGAVELITCIQAIRTGWLPPTINLRHPDPLCDLDYVPNTARHVTNSDGSSAVDVCLSNSFGFGGQNDTVVVRAFRA
ncbi:MAG: beta-ketoacyl-[acyl-carrier-protein] synthase family protein [Phycisphaerales bacterium]